MDRSYVPKYVMSTLCRICAEKSSKLTPIFESEALPKKIDKCLPIKVKESDFLPLKVCESCFFKLDESYTLHETAFKADQRLKTLWKILLKETSDNFSSSEEKKSVDKALEKSEAVISPSNLVINIPDNLFQEIEILNDRPNEVVIMKTMSFEVITENEGTIAVKSFEQENFQNQIEEVKEYQNLECQEVFSEVKQINETLDQATFPIIKEPTSLEGRPFLCDTCGKSFKHANNLRNHAKTHSSIRKKHMCKVCNKGFVTNFFLQEHMNSHTGETPYKCIVCGKEFREKVHLRQHKWTHSKEKFLCPFCGNKFNRKGNMTEHIKKYHKGKSEIRPNFISESKREEKVAQKINFKCPVCACEFPNQALLKNHLKIHPEQKRFSCSICNQKFRYSGSLTYHRRTAHTGERPFQCSYCDQKFSLRSVQKIHERKIHTFENPYKCSDCPRRFTNSSSLRNHLYVHTNEKLFECNECGKKFARSSNLAIHKKLHSDDRRFPCDQCGKRYIQKHDLMKHEKVHDPKSKPFFCKYCGNFFCHKKDFSKHALCQFDFLRKNNADFYSAEKILDSVKDSLKEDANHFLIEEQQILESVQELSAENINPDGL